MATTPKKSSKTKAATKKPKKNEVLKVAKSVPKKDKFDTEAFVFDTAIEKIEEALQRLEEQEADPMAEPLTQDQLYWFGWWTLNLPEAKKRGMTSVPTCAKEAAVLGLYEKSKKGGKKK